ncbi:polysaccharide biosynthesis protein [Haematospirillum sp. 15-248]|nr:polysaccharide biosynthesis protein [Haematospirillum sp. 15-248]
MSHGSAMRRLLSRPDVVYLHDLVMAATGFAVSVWLRFGDSAAEALVSGPILTGGLIFVGLCAVVFRWNNLYRGIWRYASVRDLLALSRAVSLSILLFLPVLFLFTRLDSFPRSLPFILWFVLLILLGGPRFAYRAWKDRSLHNIMTSSAGTNRIPVLLIGAGDGADLFIRDMERKPDAQYAVLGILSLHEGRIGRYIRGVEVLGTLDRFTDVINQLQENGTPPLRLIITDDAIAPSTLKTLFTQADAIGIPMSRLPRISDLREGIEEKITVRPVAIEDLLGRPQATLDRDAMRSLIQGRRVLITGAGGSIGSELVRQVALLDPSLLILGDHSEYALYAIDLEMQEKWPAIPRQTHILDVRHRTRVRTLFEQTKPDIVLHAAALKHVPIVEQNPLDGIDTNTLGTSIIAMACRDYNVSVMVQISTDKAVNPTNIMGASKRMAEMICQSMDLEGCNSGRTRFVTVRFGNVLGSTGSVVPLFRHQLERGGPLTVTHPDMTRYFMTIREAVELVLEASAIGYADSSYGGSIFVLDMGEPVRIVDLATQMIRLAGLVPGKDIQIAFTGTRPGEKLFEEIFHGSEPPVPTRYQGLLLARPRIVNLDELEDHIKKLEDACRDGAEGQALDILHTLVPEYTPTGSVESVSIARKHDAR